MACPNQIAALEPPCWELQPVFAPFTRPMLEKRQLPAFKGWKIGIYDATAPRAGGDPILQAIDTEIVAKKLLDLAQGDLMREIFVTILPELPTDDLDWRGLDHESLRQEADLLRWLPAAVSYECSLHQVAMRLTEAIHHEIPGYDSPADFREDDFDNHPYTPLREILIDHIQ